MKHAFTAWQTDLLRARLHNYLTREATSPDRPLSIAKFFERFRESPSMSDAIYDAVLGGASPAAICEKFRRFLKNEQTIASESLEALRSFLVGEDILSSEELDDRFDDHGEMLAIFGYLGNSRVDGLNLTRGYPYAASEGTTLTFEAFADDKRLMIVEERFVAKRGPRGNQDVRSAVRRGYAFVATNGQLLHIFLRGRSAIDRSHYVEFPCEGASSRATTLRLVRAGELSSAANQAAHLEEEPASRPFGEIRTIRKFLRNSVVTFSTAEVVYWQHGDGLFDGPVFPVVDLSLLEAAGDRNSRRLEQLLAQPNLLGGGVSREIVNMQDAEGLTPLHRAAARGSRKCVRLLVQSGKCNHLLTDDHGNYAADLALLWAKDFALARWLSRHQTRQAFERGVQAWEPPPRVAAVLGSREPA